MVPEGIGESMYVEKEKNEKNGNIEIEFASKISKITDLLTFHRKMGYEFFKSRKATHYFPCTTRA